MELVQATPADTAVLMPLVAQFYAHFSYPFEPVAHGAVVADFLVTPHYGSIWLILADGQVVGYLALTYGFTFEFGGRDAFVDELFVADAYRNRGWGGQAVRDIQGRMAELGLCALHLQTEKYNGRAKQLYLSLGFRDLERDTLTYMS